MKPETIEERVKRIEKQIVMLFETVGRIIDKMDKPDDPLEVPK